jgi:hypothetical protein
MASTFSQLPAQLNVSFVPGDEVNIALDFSNDLTGYVFQNAIFQVGVVATGGGGFFDSAGQTVTSFVVSAVDLAAGQVVIGLSETQTALLSPSASYRWYFRWISPGLVTRTVLSGAVTPVAP